MGRLTGLWGALGVALCLLLPEPAPAQDVGTVQSEILVLDPDRLFNASRVGQRLIQQYQAEREKLIANNREIEAELRAEEQSLTERRPEMDAAAFRTEADAFDAKVRELRAENERRALDLERGREIAPLTLMRMAEPILVDLMRDAGGTIILDSRQVLLRANVIDITDLAIQRIDEAIGDGSGEIPELPQDDPPVPAEPPAEPRADTPDDAATIPRD